MHHLARFPFYAFLQKHCSATVTIREHMCPKIDFKLNHRIQIFELASDGDYQFSSFSKGLMNYLLDDIQFKSEMMFSKLVDNFGKIWYFSESFHIFNRDRYRYAIKPISHSSSVKTKITVFCRWYYAMGHPILYPCCKTYVKNGRFAAFEMIIKKYFGLNSWKRWSEAILCIVIEPTSHGKHSFRISLKITEDWSLENICIMKDNFQIFEEKIIKESLAISHGTPIWPDQN